MNWKRGEYIRRQAAVVCGGAATLSAETEELLFYELTRAEEIASGRTDQWENWEWPFCQAQREGKLYRPWLDELLQSAAGIDAAPRWPGGKKWALCLTHDVDVVSARDRGLASWRGVRTELGGPRDRKRLIYRTARAVWRTLRTPFWRGDDPLWQFEKWLEVEEAQGFKSSWLFFPMTVTRRHRDDCYYRFDDPVRFGGMKMTVRDMMTEIIARGCDVGLHGSCRSFDNADMLAAQRAEVATACGRPVVSTRQHYLRYQAAATPAAHAAAGLGVDSTQGFNRTIGFRAGTCFPYWCWDHSAQRSLPVLQVPLVVMDTCLFQSGGLEYDEALALRHVTEIMERVQAAGGVLTLNWHPNNMLFLGWMETYRAILAEAARRDPWCGTLRDIHALRLEREGSR